MVFGDRLIGPCLHASLNDFNENMEHVDCPNLIIDRIYESNAAVLNGYFKDDNLKLIWERTNKIKYRYYNGKVMC